MKFRQQLEAESVRSLPLREAILIDPYTVVRGAIAIMRAKSLGCAIIVKADRIPCGIFTERSVLDLLVHGERLDEKPVCDYADSSFVCVSIDDSMLSVWKAIQIHGARFVCVTDENGQAIGLTGQRGIAEYFSECFAKQIAVQRVGGTPWIREREGA